MPLEQSINVLKLVCKQESSSENVPGKLVVSFKSKIPFEIPLTAFNEDNMSHLNQLLSRSSQCLGCREIATNGTACKNKKEWCELARVIAANTPKRLSKQVVPIDPSVMCIVSGYLGRWRDYDPATQSFMASGPGIVVGVSASVSSGSPEISDVSVPVPASSMESLPTTTDTIPEQSDVVSKKTAATKKEEEVDIVVKVVIDDDDKKFWGTDVMFSKAIAKMEQEGHSDRAEHMSGLLLESVFEIAIRAKPAMVEKGGKKMYYMTRMEYPEQTGETPLMEPLELEPVLESEHAFLNLTEFNRVYDQAFMDSKGYKWATKKVPSGVNVCIKEIAECIV
jgi:hypothetical protein